MTTYYVDLELGSDVANGLSFATAWKTVTHASTVTVPGDTVRVKASPLPTNTGQSATWTNNSTTVTLASAVTLNITTCDTSFTADSGSCTCTADSGGSNRREGTNSASHSITGGIAANTLISHFQLPAQLDLSPYQQISLAIKWQLSGAFPTNAMRVDLCSDLAGAVPVNSFLVDINNFEYNVWNILTFDNGSALGATINSVAIYAPQTWAVTGTFWLDNILACKAPSAVDSLTLNSLISKNTGSEHWWAIRSINGTTVKLDCSSSVVDITSPSNNLGYSGTTATVALWKREPVNVYKKNDYFGSLTISGTSASHITFSGGWDRTNMSTQVDKTWVDGIRSAFGGIYTSSINYLDIQNFGCVRFGEGFTVNGVGNTISNCHSVACGGHGLVLQSQLGPPTSMLGCTNTQGNSNCLQTFSEVVIIDNFESLSCVYGFNLQNRFLTLTGTLAVKNGANQSVLNNNGGFMNNVIHDGCLNQDGLVIQNTAAKLRINSITSNNSFGYGLQLSNATAVKIYNLSTTGNATGSVHVLNSTITDGEVVIHNWVNTELLKVNSDGLTNSAGYNWKLRSHNEDNIVGNHVTRADNLTIQSETGANRHTASGLAWSLAFNNVGGQNRRSQSYPGSLCVGRDYAVAGSVVTVSGWVMRSVAASVGAQLRVSADQLNGIGVSDVVASATPASDGAYEHLTLTFTPTESGVFEVYFDAWPTGGVYTGVAYIDDTVVSQ